MSEFSKMLDAFVDKMMNENSELVEKLLNAMDGVHKSDHTFDENSDKCKKCKSFDNCKIATSIKKKIKESEFSDGVKEEMLKFIGYIKHEFTTFETFNAKEILSAPKDEAIGISAFYRRFKGADNHLDKFVAICDEEELKHIRTVIRKVDEKIMDMCYKIMDDNRIDTNNLLNKLTKVENNE